MIPKSMIVIGSILFGIRPTFFENATVFKQNMRMDYRLGPSA